MMTWLPANTVLVIMDAEHILGHPCRIIPFLSSKDFFIITALAVAGHPVGAQELIERFLYSKTGP